jgi:hypothetical protein
MFGLFKKKPIEVKYGRENYLSNPNNYEINDENWILALSSVFVEAMDLDVHQFDERVVQHDQLLMYPESHKMGESLYGLLEDELIYESPKEIRERMDTLLDLWYKGYEADLYLGVNAESLEDVKAKAQEKHDDDDERIELCEKIWKNKERYETMHYHVASLAHMMWQIRLAAYLNVIHPNVAWSQIQKLAEMMRPIMTLFDSWEAYNHNILCFYEIYHHDNLWDIKFTERAIACLNLREESHLKQMPIHFGVDQDYPYNLREHSYRYAPRIDREDDPTLIMLLGLMEKEDKAPLWKALDNLTGLERDHNFSFFISKCNRENFAEEDLLELPEHYPEVHYAYMIRANYFDDFAWEARGTGTANTVGEENYRLFHERLAWAREDLKKAYELEPNEPVIWANLYANFSLSYDDKGEREKFYNLIKEKGLSNRYCTLRVSNFKQERWGGSHQENIDWANYIIANTKRGDVTRLIIFDVTIERYDYIRAFEDNDKKAEAIFKDKKIQNELNQYFDELVENMEKLPYSIAETLIYWYCMANDLERLRKVAQTMKAGQFDLDAMNDEYNETTTVNMMHWIRSV